MRFNASKFNNHWQNKKLAELGTFQRGKSRHRPRNDPALFEGGTYPLVQTGEIKENNLYVRSHTAMYNDFGLAQSHIWPENTLCITIAANIAETALLGYPMCFPDSIVGFNAYPNESSELFMHYVFTYIRKAIQSSASGSIQDNINIDYLTNLDFKIPQKPEQDKIAGILAYLDTKIELNNKINHELETMAKLIYDYWFVQFDFPDANGKPYKSSGGKMDYKHELNGEIPIDWKVGHCSELFKFNPSLSIKKGKECHYIDMNSLPTAGFMTNAPCQKSFSGGMKFQNGDVLLARITPCLENGKTGLVSLLDNDEEIGFGSTEFIVLRGKNFDLRCFGSCLARSEKFRKYAISKMTGTSGRKRVHYTDLESYIMPIPDETLLKKFEALLSPFFKIMTNNIKESQILSDLRDWLLPMLMSGQMIVK